MSKTKKAKTASKNNPITRSQAQKFFYSGKQVKPAEVIMNNKSFSCAEYDDGELVTNKSGDPISWAQIQLVSTRS